MSPRSRHAFYEPGRIHSPRELRPYDALSDRFLRAFESSLKFFRTGERAREASVSKTFMQAFGTAGDGITDDTAAIQRAMDSGRPVVFLPRAAYVVDGTLIADTDTRTGTFVVSLLDSP